MKLHFHDWKAVLQESTLPDHRKESTAITIRWYLSWRERMIRLIRLRKYSYLIQIPAEVTAKTFKS